MMKENNIEKLVGDNLNFVKSVANKYVGKGVEFDDLVSEGYMAMVQAAQKFDGSRGSHFIGYASPFIRKAMKLAIEQAGVCRIPKNLKKQMPASPNSTVSIDTPLNDNTHFTLLDVIINKDALMADEHVAFEQMMKDLQNCIAGLDAREQEVIKKFYGINIGHLSLADIAEDMGLKRERVRQIRDKAIRKIRKNATSKVLKNFLRK